MDQLSCAVCDARVGAADRYCGACGATLPGTEHSGVASRCRPWARWVAATLLSMGRPPLALASAGIDTAPATTAGTAEGTTTSAPVFRPRWYRRPFILATIAVVALLLAATLLVVLDIHRTFRVLNQVSTPAPEVAGSALGGGDSVMIDTGPAQAAVADAAPVEPTATEAAEVDTADAPLPPPPVGSGGEGEGSETLDASQAPATSASPPASATPPAGTAEASPTPETPEPATRLSEIERIKNGSFEEGDAGWHIEGGAGSVEAEAVSGVRVLRIPADGGFADQAVVFLIGTTYQLSGWGKLTAPGDEALMGVSYRDATGQRLLDLEPVPVRFTGTTYRRRELTFTVPPGVAQVKVYLWKGTGSADFFADDLSLRSVIPNDRGSASGVTDQSMTILVMGVDARPGEPIDVGVRPDSLMVLRLNPETGSCRVLAIPRDTRTELPGYGLTKVNHALAVGGIPYQQQVVERLLDLKLDHYVLIDFAGFKELVDAVGGITVNVPGPLVTADGIAFAAGEQRMNGEQALSYARYRGGPDGDFGRIARQQQVLRALAQRASGLNVVRSLNELLPALRDHIRTDLTVTEMAAIAVQYRNRCTDTTIEMFRLEGYGAMFDDPLLNLPLWYLIVDEAEVRRKVRMLLEP